MGLFGLVSLAVVLLGLFVPAAATVELPGAWPAAWSSYTLAGGGLISDVNSDQTPTNLDLASGTCPSCAGPASTVALTSGFRGLASEAACF